MQSYSYAYIETPAPTVPHGQSTLTKQLVINITFNQTALTNLIKSTNQTPEATHADTHTIPTPLHTVYLQITQIPGLNTYVDLSKFLKDLACIHDLSMENLQSNAITFKLTLNDTDETLQAALKQNSQLQFVDENTLSDAITTFTYQYITTSPATQDLTAHGNSAPAQSTTE